VFLAGQIGLIPESMIVAPQSTAQQQLARALKNNSAVLKEMQSSVTLTLLCIVYVSIRVNASEYDAIRRDCTAVLRHSGDADKSPLPVVLIVVPELPRSALVEVQVVNYQNSLAKHLWNVKKVGSGLPITYFKAHVGASSDSKQVTVTETGVCIESQFLTAFAALTACGDPSTAPSAAAFSSLVAVLNRRCTNAKLSIERHAISFRVYYDQRIDAAIVQKGTKPAPHSLFLSFLDLKPYVVCCML
jgi:enamine deaminase RidA (YjgF/YER057c/UK114 family)